MAKVTVDFSDTTVFVAGGTSGINLGIAEAFAAAGARVAVMSRSAEKVNAAVTRLRSLGAEATGAAADVRDWEATNAALRLAHEAFGDIDRCPGLGRGRQLPGRGAGHVTQCLSLGC